MSGLGDRVPVVVFLLTWASKSQGNVKYKMSGNPREG